MPCATSTSLRRHLIRSFSHHLRRTIGSIWQCARGAQHTAVLRNKPQHASWLWKPYYAPAVSVIGLLPPSVRPSDDPEQG